MFHQLGKCVGHRWKPQDIVWKIWAPLRKLFAPLVSQAGYGPCENHDISFEAPFTFRLAGYIDMLFFRCFFVIFGFCLLFGWMLCFAGSLSGLWKYFFYIISVYIINSLLAAKGMYSWVPYLFDCKPRLIRCFHRFMRRSIKHGLRFLFFFTLSKGIDQCSSTWVPQNI